MKALILFIALGLVTVGCGKIPKPYRGTYRDSQSGAELTLKINGGELNLSGRVIASKAMNLEYKRLLKGKQGIYLLPNPTNPNWVEAYWLSPDLTTQQSEGGLEYFQAEAVYFVFRLDREERIDQLEGVHSQNAWILYDTVEETLKVGWAAGAEEFHFSRID